LKQRTFILLKPETVAHRNVGKIITRIEKTNLKIIAMKLIKLPPDQAEILYETHKGKSFFGKLVEHITSGPIIVILVEGDEAVATIRKLCGITNPLEAEVGSIRKLYGLNITMNAIHAADSIENAQRESRIFFESKEIIN
jgi:nucleoside-diphosphate kinase